MFYTDGKLQYRRGEFHLQIARPLGDEPILSAPAPEGYAQTDQMNGAPVAQSPNVASSRPEQQGGGMLDKLKDAVS
jgi:Mn-containing catalase